MKKYYLCVRGHVVQFSEKSDSAAIAAVHCFKTTESVTVLEVGPRISKVAELYERLRELHQKATGKRLLPAAQCTILPRPLITQCPCGSGKSSWMEYSPFRQVPLCRVCVVCLPSRKDWLAARRYL